MPGLAPHEQLVGLTNSRAHVRAGVITPAMRPPRTASPDAPSCSSAWKRPLQRATRIQRSSSTAAARRPLCIGMLLPHGLAPTHSTHIGLFGRKPYNTQDTSTTRRPTCQLPHQKTGVQMAKLPLWTARRPGVGF